MQSVLAPGDGDTRGLVGTAGLTAGAGVRKGAGAGSDPVAHVGKPVLATQPADGVTRSHLNWKHPAPESRGRSVSPYFLMAAASTSVHSESVWHEPKEYRQAVPLPSVQSGTEANACCATVGPVAQHRQIKTAVLRKEGCMVG